MSKRGENIYKRKDGRWEGRFCDGRLPNGRKHYVSVYGNLYREVKEKMVDRKRALPSFTGNKITFQDAGTRWLTFIKVRVKPSTFANYEYLLKKHIFPYFGQMDMKNLSGVCANRFITEKLENGRLNGGGGISPKYTRDMFSIVKSIASFCEQQYGIPNQITGVTVLRADKKEMKVLNDLEQKRLVAFLFDNLTTCNLGILLSLYTGLRLGEVCGLLWEDFDDRAGLLTIRRTIQRISDNKGSTRLVTGAPKTASSLRKIPLPAFLWEILSVKKRADKQPIISNNDKFTEPATLRRCFKQILKICGISDIRYHDLRHTFATNCVRKQFDVKTLSEILGHANVAMTLNRYVHSSIETKRNYMNLLSI